MVMLVDNKEGRKKQQLMWQRILLSQWERCQTLSSTVFPQVQVGCQDGSCELPFHAPQTQIRKEKNQRNPEDNPLENVF
jgi:hypothetical protein